MKGLIEASSARILWPLAGVLRDYRSSRADTYLILAIKIEGISFGGGRSGPWNALQSGKTTSRGGNYATNVLWAITPLQLWWMRYSPRNAVLYLLCVLPQQEKSTFSVGKLTNSSKWSHPRASLCHTITLIIAFLAFFRHCFVVVLHPQHSTVERWHQKGKKNPQLLDEMWSLSNLERDDNFSSFDLLNIGQSLGRSRMSSIPFCTKEHDLALKAFKKCDQKSSGLPIS